MGNGFPLPEGREGWKIGKEFLAGRVKRDWHRVPSKAVAAPGSLKVFKDEAWNSWDSGRCLRPWQGWDRMSFKGPSDPNYSMILPWQSPSP